MATTTGASLPFAAYNTKRLFDNLRKHTHEVDSGAFSGLPRYDSAPEDAEAGFMYFNTVTGMAMLYDGSGWVPVIVGGSDITVTIDGTVDTELTTEDYDTGAGTDEVAVVGILLPKSGGAVAGGTSSDPIRTDPTGTTAQPVTDNGGSLTVDGTVTVQDGGSSLSVDDNGSTLSVDDGGGSLTVDGAVSVSNFPSSVEVSNDSGNPLPVSGTVTANAGTGPWPVTDNSGSLTVDDGGSTLSVDDGGSSLTVDGSVTADTELATKDYDSGAGTDTQAVVGILLPKSGGAVAGGTSTDPLRTDPTGTTAQPVTDNGGSLTIDGTVTANAGTGPWPVTDNGGSLTVDDGGNALSVVSTATTQAYGDAISNTRTITFPSDVFNYVFNGTTWDRLRGGTDGLTIKDGGNVISVDDAGGSLTVDVGTALPAGTNNIGDVDVLTLPAIPTGTNTIGTVRTIPGTGVLDNAGTTLTVKVAHLDMTTATTSDIVASVASKKIRVVGYQVFVNEATATNINFARGAGTTRVTGSPVIKGNVVNMQANVVAASGSFCFETASGEALRVTQDGATDISVAVQYVEV